jgi:hypothetical protein
VSFTLGGTATFGSDYTLSSIAPGFTASAGGGSVQCTPGALAPVVTMTPLRDFDDAEGTESVSIALVDPASPKSYWLDTFTAGAASSAAVSITNTPTPVRTAAAGGASPAGLRPPARRSSPHGPPAADAPRPARSCTRPLTPPTAPPSPQHHQPPPPPSAPQKPTVNVAVTGPTLVAETGAATALTFTFTLSAAAALPVDVNFRLSAAGGAYPAPVCSSDYLPGSVVISPNTSGSSFGCAGAAGGAPGGVARVAAGGTSVNVTVPFVNDPTLDGLEQLTVSLDPGATYNTGTPSSATGYVTDVPVRASAVSGGRG